MRKKLDMQHFIEVARSGHPGSIYSVSQTGVAEAFTRAKLTQAECQKQGVRFLPAQVMRPIFRAHGI